MCDLTYLRSVKSYAAIQAKAEHFFVLFGWLMAFTHGKLPVLYLGSECSLGAIKLK